MTTDETKKIANQLAASLNPDCIVAADVSETTDWLDGEDNELRENLEIAITTAQNAVLDGGATEAFILLRVKPAPEAAEA